MTREDVHTDAAPAPGGAYSQGLVAGDFLFTAALGPLAPETNEIAGGTIEEQTSQVMRNIEAVLATRGLDFSDVVKTVAHLADVGRDRQGFDATYQSFLTPPYPVRTTVQSGVGSALVVIEAVALLRERTAR